MFAQRRNRNMIEAGFTTLSLIYHITANNLRKGQRNAVVGLLMTVAQAVVMIVGFYLMFAIMGVRKSPIRGDFIVYIMTGIFMFMAHTQAIGAVAGAGGPANQMMKHGPMNTAVMMAGAALAALYRQTFSSIVVLVAYNYLIQPIHIYKPLACYGMLLMAWFSGCCIGLIFLAFRPWWPQGATVLTSFYQRMNMIFPARCSWPTPCPPSCCMPLPGTRCSTSSTRRAALPSSTIRRATLRSAIRSTASWRC